MRIIRKIFAVLSQMRRFRLRSPLGRRLFLDLMIYFVLLAVIPALAIGYFTLNRARTQTIAQATAQLESVAEFKRAQLGNWLEENRYTQDIILADSERLERVVTLLAGDAPEEESAAINRILFETVEANRFFSGLFLYDTRGSILAASEATEIRKVVRRQPYFDASLAEEDHIEPPYFDIARNQLVIVQTRQIEDQNGEIVGVLAGWLDTSALGAIMLERAGLGDTGETYLVSLENHYFLTPSHFADEGYAMNRAYESAGIDQALAGVEGADIYSSYRGKTVIGVYRWMPELQVGLLAELEQDEALTLFQETSTYIVSLTTLGAVIAAVAGVVIASQITRPISHLKGLAERLSGGDLTARARLKAKNELGVLGQAFNNMAEDLNGRIEAEQTSRESLEATVALYMAFVQQVAEGDLTSRLELDGDLSLTKGMSDDLYMLGSNLNLMVENLSQMTVQIRETAARISSATIEIQAAATQQIATATEQDAAITQTMATTEEVRITVSQTAERAQAVVDASEQSIVASRQGQDAVTNTIQGMERIRLQVEDIAENILLLSERTQQIGDIIDTVNAIADQSKMLALNASIEAARAGEEGRGFSVVALEVRKLAEQSREATTQVRDILNEIQQATNTAVMVTEEGSKGAESGMDLVNRAGEVIQELAATLRETSEAAARIAASTHQQINGTDQLSIAMASIKQASVQATSSTRQTEQSVRDLVEMARQMEQAVARYRLQSDLN